MHVIISAAYHLAPIVIVISFFHAFRSPFAIQLQYDLIYRWNVLLITTLTVSHKIHLHLFICQLGSVTLFQPLARGGVFFTSKKLPFLVFQPKHPRFMVLALKAYKCTYSDQEKASLCVSLHCKRGIFLIEIRTIGNLNKGG